MTQADQVPATTARQEAEAVDSERLPAKAYADMSQAEAIEAFGPEILGRHASGETITDICDFAIVPGMAPTDKPQLLPREAKSFPARTTVYDWCYANPEFARRFAHARALWREALRDGILSIADDGRRDFVPTKEGYMVDVEHVQRSKLRIYAREQLLDRAKWQGILGDEAATKGQPKALPPRIEVVGIEPKRSPMPAPGAPIEGQAVRVQPDEDED